MASVKHKLIKNFFEKEELSTIQKYCYNALDLGQYMITSQSFSPAWYNDPLMTALLETKKIKVEKESNLKLFPTYSYWRYYVFGGTLAKHLDRPSCEVSVTACIKKQDNWPIIVEGNKFELQEGDALLYAGCVEEHERPGIYKGEGMSQVFFHYVDKNGYFTNHAYDRYWKETGEKFTAEEFKILETMRSEK